MPFGNKFKAGIAVLILSLLTPACTLTPTEEAPIIDGWQQPAFSGDYRVQPGDTIYSIAWSFGMDYRAIAKFNQLTEPYHLHPGQWLYMASRPAISAAALIPEGVAPRVTRRSTVGCRSGRTRRASGLQRELLKDPVHRDVKASSWQWPTVGKVVRGYSPAFGGNRGLDIKGKFNQPVLAAAAGKVVYTGSSMPGYGNLIIIKHNDNDLSAYAFNKTLMVTEGQIVKTGQTIAMMGKNERGETMLHFEIRRSGKPVDPRRYLKND